MKSPRICIFLALSMLPTAVCGWAQDSFELQIGGRVGVPVTRYLESNTPRVSRQETFDRSLFLLGPTFGAVVHDRFLFQLEAVYKRIRGRSKSIIPPDGATFEYRAASFEFPVLLDYYFSNGSRRAFAGGGVVAGHITKGSTKSGLAGSATAPYSGQFALGNQLPAYVANAGMEWRKPRLIIRPEIRYTRWDRNPGAQIRQNQIEISVAFSRHR